MHTKNVLAALDVHRNSVAGNLAASPRFEGVDFQASDEFTVIPDCYFHQGATRKGPTPVILIV